MSTLRVLPAAQLHSQQADAAASGPADPTKFSGKKSKAMSKKGAGATQWEILLKSGIPAEEIPLFRWARSCKGVHQQASSRCTKVRVCVTSAPKYHQSTHACVLLQALIEAAPAACISQELCSDGRTVSAGSPAACAGKSAAVKQQLHERVSNTNITE